MQLLPAEVNSGLDTFVEEDVGAGDDFESQAQTATCDMQSRMGPFPSIFGV